MHIFIYSFICVFKPSLTQVFIPLWICVFSHLITLPLQEHLVAPTVATGDEGQALSPPGGTHRP